MSTPFRVFGKTLVAAFCMWHLFAVGAYSVPLSFTGKLRNWLSAHNLAPERAQILETLRWKVAGPYLLLTSQWQQWNMFSPNPVRSVLAMQVEQEVGENSWRVIRSVVPQTMPWWRSTREVKILYTIGMDDNGKAVRKFILESDCRILHLPEGTNIRLVLFRYTLPQNTTRIPAVVWAAYKPNTERSIDATVTCPAAS